MNKKPITKELVMQKIVEGFVKEHPQMMEDIVKLAHELTMFNVKWGTKLEPNDFYQQSLENHE